MVLCINIMLQGRKSEVCILTWWSRPDYSVTICLGWIL